MKTKVHKYNKTVQYLEQTKLAKKFSMGSLNFRKTQTHSSQARPHRSLGGSASGSPAGTLRSKPTSASALF